MTALHIAVLVDKFPSVSETFVLNQLTGLMDLGHRVDIYPVYRGTFLQCHQDVLRYGLLERTYHQQLPLVKSWRNLRIIGLLIWRLWMKPGTLARILSVLRLHREALRLKILTTCWSGFRRNHYDIIHCHFGPMGNLAAVLKCMGATEGKVVVTFHGYDIRLGEEFGNGLYRPIAEAADRFLSISPYNRRFLESWGLPQNKIVNHPVGVDIDRFKPSSQGREKVEPEMILLTVARLIDLKGLDVALQAVKQLAQRVPRIRLRYIIVGNGSRYLDLLKMAEDLGLLPIVHFYRDMEQEQVAKLMRRSNIYLSCSRAEALPVSLMEASASGLPVIATRVGSVAEIVRDGKSGFLVPSGDVECIVDKLELLCAKARLRESMGVNGRDLVAEKYNIEVLNKCLEGLFRDLCMSSAGRK